MSSEFFRFVSSFSYSFFLSELCIFLPVPDSSFSSTLVSLRLSRVVFLQELWRSVVSVFPDSFIKYLSGICSPSVAPHLLLLGAILLSFVGWMGMYHSCRVLHSYGCFGPVRPAFALLNVCCRLVTFSLVRSPIVLYACLCGSVLILPCISELPLWPPVSRHPNVSVNLFVGWMICSSSAFSLLSSSIPLPH